jgi:catechol 2,3-dioxygenase-like lactoylglutathione lyase family enzyme
MKLEHIAFDVPDPEAFIAWWCGNLGFRCTAPGFIADDSGVMCLEIYRTGETPSAPDYAAANAMTMHIAFVSADVKADADRLVAAGARLESIQIENPDFHVAILRDPWGVPVQLCRRAKTVFLN